MPYVSPDDKRTTRFRAIVKKEVIVDFHGDEPVIIEEAEEFNLVMPFTNVNTGYVITSSADLIEASQCSSCGEMVPVEDIEDGECSACRALHIRQDLNDMSQAALIRRLLELEKMVGSNQPKQKSSDDGTVKRRGRPAKNMQQSVSDSSQEEDDNVKSFEDIEIPSQYANSNSIEIDKELAEDFFDFESAIETPI